MSAKDLPEIGSHPRVGVVGPTDLVAEVVSCFHGSDIAGLTVAAYAYDSDRGMTTAARKAAANADAVLFTGPVPYDRAVAGGPLRVPATHIPLDGEALYRALLAVSLRHPLADITFSIDTLQTDAVAGVLTELGLDAGKATVIPYDHTNASGDARSVAGLHRAAIDHGAAVALTCRRSVEQLLHTAGIEPIRVVPTTPAIVTALRTAGLLARGAIAHDAQLAMCLIGVDRFDSLRRNAVGLQQLRELGGELQRIVVREAATLSATVIPLSLDSVLMVTTVGALLSPDGSHRLEAISRAVADQLGLSVSIGLGTGQTAQHAEESAYRALAAAQERGGGQVVVIGPDGSERDLPEGAAAAGSGGPGIPDPAARRDRDRLLAALPATGPGDQLLTDSSAAATALDVSERTARRILNQLAVAGLAWPVTATAGDRGRPRQRFRIVRDSPAVRPAGTDSTSNDRSTR